MIRLEICLKIPTMDKIILEDISEYNLVVSRGYEPLLSNKYFVLDIKLREMIQKKMFGHCVIGRGSNIMAANERLFRWVWDHKPHYCEECLKPLKDFSAVYCSHIVSRGAFPEMAHDPRNINILCFKHHNEWENGSRERMRIYPGNKRIIAELMKDYNIDRKEVQNNG